MLGKSSNRKGEISKADRFRVVQDAVIGGGFDLRAGQVVESMELGSYARLLLDSGAVVRVQTDASSA